MSQSEASKDAGQLELDAPLAPQVVTDLLRVGLVQAAEGPSGRTLRMTDPGLRLFLPMLQKFDVRLVPMDRPDCPVCFCTGILKTGNGAASSEKVRARAIPAGGQAKTRIGAAMSCLGELAERLTLCTQQPSDSRVRQEPPEQSQVELGPLLGFSVTQEKQVFENLPEGVRGSTARVDGWSELAGRRVPVRSLLTGAAGELPAAGVLFGEVDKIDRRLPGVASSVGCAVWSTLEGARERALLELVERDAVAQCWYNRLGITEVTHSVLESVLPTALVVFLSLQKRSWRVFSVDTDLDAHVVLAISHQADGLSTVFGSAAGWTLAAACESALQELLQAENALELMEQAYPQDKDGAHASNRIPSQLAYARSQSILQDLPLNEAAPADDRNLSRKYSAEGLWQGLRSKNFEIWEFDATRSDLNIPCVKLLSPDLCSWEPRFGKKRLYEGVVQRGLRSVPAQEAEFAARPFPF